MPGKYGKDFAMAKITDFILNGQPTGDVATRLINANMDPRVLRPYIGSDGKSYETRIVNGEARAVPMTNATATLRKDDWIQLDAAAISAAKPRLKLVNDLRGAGLQYVIPNGMGKTILQTQAMSDISDADISMDAIRTTAGDRPHFDLTNLPLPIISKDFSFSSRQIAASRNDGSPLDTTAAELAGQKVAEEAEKLALGTLDEYTYGGGTVYGLINYENAIAQVLTNPTTEGWAGTTLLDEVLEMIQASQDHYYYGPWRLYVSPNWGRYLNGEFKAASDKALRTRLLEIEGISDILTLDYLTGYKMVLVMTSPSVVRIVVGMEMTTVEWDSHGGMQKNFKVMAIYVPQVRCDFNGNTGIVYGNVA